MGEGIPTPELTKVKGLIGSTKSASVTDGGAESCHIREKHRRTNLRRSVGVILNQIERESPPSGEVRLRLLNLLALRNLTIMGNVKMISRPSIA